MDPDETPDTPDAPDDAANAAADQLAQSTAMVDAANAKIAELMTTNAALAAELQATKAANWDLLQAVPSPDTGADSDPDNSENNTDDDDAEPSIDDFFGSPKEND